VSPIIEYTVRSGVAVITLNNPPVNGLSHELRQQLVDGIVLATNDPDVHSIVLIGSDWGFSGGADVREFGTPRAVQEPLLRTLIRHIEECSKPVIAAVSGPCMGGGLELAMGCHFRVVAADAELAQPEVKLGLMPGAGGTQRLPRLVGVERAISMITTGETIRASALRETALIDELVEGDLRAAALEFAIKVTSEHRRPQLAREISLAGAANEEFLAAARSKLGATSGHTPAPLSCVEAITAAVKEPFDEGLRIERELFDALLRSPQSRALRHAFFAERTVNKIPGVSEKTLTRSVASVGVVGAGTMGGGIAMSFLNAGLPVCVLESSSEALDRGIDKIKKNYQSSLKRGKITQAQVDERIASLRTTLRYGDLGDCDLVVEAVFEDMAVKKEVFVKLDAIAKPGAILASNTSTLDLDQIALATNRPRDVIGLHFFSPAHVMRLLEIVRGKETADDVLKTGLLLAKRMKQIAVVAGVCDGFIGNRMLHKYQAAAEQLLVQGATPAQVDRALEEFGMAMGPFKVGDLAGLDIGWSIRKRRAATNPEQASPRIADWICEAGRFGQKTGSGWYRYEPGARTPVDEPATAETIEKFRAKAGVAPRPVSDDEIVTRCVYSLINEGARIVEEGIAYRASDIDVVWLNGYGFPRHRGGPMFYANEIGLQEVVRGLQSFATAEQDGPTRWTPAPLLEQLAVADAKFV
jgi:3-hydroxyacyl-CoA dehydrogenase